MSREEKIRELFTQLLSDYRDAKEVEVHEFSTSVDEDLKAIEPEIDEYKRKLEDILGMEEATYEEEVHVLVPKGKQLKDMWPETFARTELGCWDSVCRIYGRERLDELRIKMEPLKLEVKAVMQEGHRK